jgi:uncharacterized protein (TIGR03086 family)
MSDIADRYRAVAAELSARVDGTSPDDWTNPAPCAGWVASDIVDHLVTWVPGVLAAGAGVQMHAGPDATTDPAGAWRSLDQQIQALLDDPATAVVPFVLEPVGEMTLEVAIDRLVLGDVLVHTWDLARATHQDDRLLPDEVARMLGGIQHMGEAMRASGHYGPEVVVAPGADDQDRLIAFTGRTP